MGLRPRSITDDDVPVSASVMKPGENSSIILIRYSLISLYIVTALNSILEAADATTIITIA